MRRRNNPFGEVGKVLEEWPSKARIGYCRDWQGKCFEPPDEFKGDLARAHFYLSVRYAGVWECCETKVTNRTAVSTLAESTLRRWHRQDPVSERERRRNDLIHSRFQGTRNPFVDCPTFEARIQDF
ncbi:endonuclease I [Baffinella frigidus]|nr:endonuclease I [Cryptophyta sp. CCMP2293]